MTSSRADLSGPAVDAAAESRPLVLSPSRAADFKTCPLMYRFRAIDHLPEPPSRAAALGTLVHAVLERMFGMEALSRTEAAVVDSIEAVWAGLADREPELLAAADPDPATWFGAAGALLHNYFRLEDPAALTPEGCELAIDVELADGTPLKGFIDRLDVTESGDLRVVDYKTGRSPSNEREISALFQLKFYALMIFRRRGVIPTELKLIYLADSCHLTYQPDVAELKAFERTLVVLWDAILAAARTGEFPPNRSGFCRWCAHQARCPEFGGNPPDYPADLVFGPRERQPAVGTAVAP